jgi:hypothetical protein
MVLTLTVDSSAAALAPTKPSQILTVVANLSSAPSCPGGIFFQVNTVAKADGSTAEFAIPKGFVFVVTSFDWSSFGLQPGTFAEMDVTAVSAAGPFGAIAIGHSIVSSDGGAGSNVVVPSGLIVKPPAILCFLPESEGVVSSSVQVHGFLTKDK